MRRMDDLEKDRSVFGSGIGQGRMIGFIVRILSFIFLGKLSDRFLSSFVIFAGYTHVSLIRRHSILSDKWDDYIQNEMVLPEPVTC